MPRAETITEGDIDVKHVLRTECQACREPLHDMEDTLTTALERARDTGEIAASASPR